MTDITLRDQIVAKLNKLDQATRGDALATGGAAYAHLPAEKLAPVLDINHGAYNNITFTYRACHTAGPFLARELGVVLEDSGLVHTKKSEFVNMDPGAMTSHVTFMVYTGSLPIAPETLSLLDKVETELIRLDTSVALGRHFNRLSGLVSGKIVPHERSLAATEAVVAALKPAG